MTERPSSRAPSEAPRTVGPGLSQVSDHELLRLLRAIEGGRIDRVTEEALAGLGLAHLAEHTRMLRSLNDSGIRAAILAALAERSAQAPPAEVLWSGPGAASELRDPAVAVADLLERADRHVLIAGFDFSWGRRIFEPLLRRLLAHGVEVHVFIDTEASLSPDERPADEDAWAAAAARKFVERNGPTLTERGLRVFCVGPGPRNHGRCVIVDDREALVTSSDFSDIGQTSTVEVGILVRDPVLSATLGDQWRALVESGHAREASPASANGS